MTDFTVSLAGIPIGISAQFPTTKEYLSEYLSNSAAPAFSIEITDDDLAYERRQSELQDERDGVAPRPHSDRYLETLAVLRKIAEELPKYDALLVHGTVVAVNGSAYMFTAPSGTGKTTHARLWLDLLPGAHILNGDKPFLKVSDGGVIACGTPWRGKERYGVNEQLPLKAIVFIERDTANHIEDISWRDALSPLLRQVYNSRSDLLSAITVLEKIGGSVRLCRLGCTMDPDAARVSIGHLLGVQL